MTDVAPFVRLCGNLAPLASFVGFLSPWPTVQRFRGEGRVGNLPLLPYTIMIINCLFYLTYGILVREIRIWTSNGVGLCLGIYYFVAYLPFVPPSATAPASTGTIISSTAGDHHDKNSDTTKKQTSPLPGTLQQHFRALLFAVAYIAATLLVSSDPAFVIGKVGMGICVSLFASPLAAIRVVLETKSSRSIPLPFTVAMTVNCFCWFVFGLWQAHDSNVYIPNGLGLCFQLAQVGLKLYFVEDNSLLIRRPSDRDGADQDDGLETLGQSLIAAQAPAAGQSTSSKPKKLVVTEHV